MTQGRYWRKFYRHFNWDKAYENRCEGMRRWLAIPRAAEAAKPVTAMNARMILDAYYRGRWHTVWGVFTDACWSHYSERYSDMWEWIRTKVFRRPRNPDLVIAERLDEEDAAVAELASHL